ncbi:ecm3p [Saccharomyces arboricola H-6]|uniref:Ecm3p n=1 Tax=Saccharomyces arboricola (strain H-6 / AS 2.3317 / CBS 10644) TaxID=1160507 RepID=J8LI38_SACAR|nr:ecm3p [Saccharomyces arboricola H-6]
MTHITLGQAIWASVRPIIKIYLIIGVGFGLCKMNILTVQATRSISDIVLTVLLPCLSFNKIVANIEDNDIKDVGIICLTSVILFATGLGFALIVRSLLPVPKRWRGGILAGGMFPNISDLPIAYLQSMDQGFIFSESEGEKGVANVIIFLAMFLICVFNLGGFRLIENDFQYKSDDDEENTLLDQDSAQQPTPPIEGNSSSSYNQDIIKEANESTVPNSSQASYISEKGNKKGNTEIPVPKPTHTVAAATDDRSTNSSAVVSIDSITHSLRTNHMDSQSVSGLNDPTYRTRSQPVAYTTDSRMTHLHNNRRNSVTGSLRSVDMRELPAEDMNDLIHEYSNVDQYGKRRKSSVSSQRSPSIFQADGTLSPNLTRTSTIQRVKASNLTRIITSDATVSKNDIETSGSSLPKWLQRFPLTKFFVFFLKNCLRPCSMAVILALIIAFIPWVKALFVTSSHTPKIKQAPDNAPALTFIMDFTSYVGAASVPFGLILLGATLGRLKIGKLYPGFWKSAVVLVFLRQCIMPIFGVLWCDRLVKAGWLNWEDDKMLLFVTSITWNLPTMTTLIYFTASFTPEDETEPIQMECTSFFLMLQYPLMVVSLPFLVSYFLKVQMKL